MISVIIPTLNEEKLIGQTLAQFTLQLVERYDLELIISDGGSTDRTIAMVTEALADFGARGILIRHDKPHRQTIAEGRNEGARNARGDLFVFINADTRFKDANRFFLSIQNTMSDRNLLAATCAVQVFPEEERGIDRAFHLVHNGYCRMLNAIGEGMGRGECHIVRREIFIEMGGYNASMAAGEDFDLFRRIRRRGKIAFLPGIVIYESPRRFRRYGYARIVWGWTKNALAVMLRNKSSSQEWETVR